MAPVIGVILMVMLTIILALMVLLIFHMPQMNWEPEAVPTIFEISTIYHTNERGDLTHESYMVVQNIGKTPYDNRFLYAKTYKNGKLLPCIIPTMNGDGFIQVHVKGIKTIGGEGTTNYLWNPKATLHIDYNQKTFKPGDIVQLDVYDRRTNQILSRDIWPHTSGNTKKWMTLLFSHRGA